MQLTSLPDSGNRNLFLSGLIRPARRLDDWVPIPDQVTGASTLYTELRHRWADFGMRTGLPAPATDLADARTMTWGQVMDDSVFFPGPPVFRGATFIDALSASAASSLLDKVGPGGIIDFFCFMLQVHETMHRYQAGEPLLNEVVQAALWSRFLTQESLWPFQRDEAHCLVREAGVVDQFPILVDAATSARLDTARMIESIGSGNAYFACCALASRFDHGFIRYREYLTRLGELLAIRSDAGAIREASLSLFF